MRGLRLLINTGSLFSDVAFFRSEAASNRVNVAPALSNASTVMSRLNAPDGGSVKIGQLGPGLSLKLAFNWAMTFVNQLE